MERFQPTGSVLLPLTFGVETRHVRWTSMSVGSMDNATDVAVHRTELLTREPQILAVTKHKRLVGVTEFAERLPDRPAVPLH